MSIGGLICSVSFFVFSYQYFIQEERRRSYVNYLREKRAIELAQEKRAERIARMKHVQRTSYELWNAEETNKHAEGGGVANLDISKQQFDDEGRVLRVFGKVR